MLFDFSLPKNFILSEDTETFPEISGFTIGSSNMFGIVQEGELYGQGRQLQAEEVLEQMHGDAVPQAKGKRQQEVTLYTKGLY